ncbi:MAG: hypothetical protein HYW63_01010 [Candidatus Levybacteria bacterium]|nr:hypothetical protein [Candidatus Levybacteria bacterium]
MKNTFSPSVFFDLSDFKHKEIFEVENVWETVSKISDFIRNNNGPKNVVIGKGTVIEEGALIKGLAIIGDNCFIAHGAYIREGAIIGDNVKIGHCVEIKNSVILNNTNVAHFNYVGDSIVGNDVNIGGGAIIANFRLDGQTIKIKYNGKHFDTNLKKLGAIVGDKSKIGVNSVLNPGTILSRNSKVFPLTSVFGTHFNEDVIK